MVPFQTGLKPQLGVFAEDGVVHKNSYRRPCVERRLGSLGSKRREYAELLLL